MPRSHTADKEVAAALLGPLGSCLSASAGSGRVIPWERVRAACERRVFGG